MTCFNHFVQFLIFFLHLASFFLPTGFFLSSFDDNEYPRSMESKFGILKDLPISVTVRILQPRLDVSLLRI